MAAERALQDGEDVEDTLWVGSGRFEGSLVRRQLLQASTKSSRRVGGSQQLLQSMRFWESLRSSARRPSRVDDSVRFTAGPHTQRVSSQVSRKISGMFTNASKSPLQSHLDNYAIATGSHNGHLSRQEQLQRANALLSMRCEASRSMRRQRGNHHAIRQWMDDHKPTLNAPPMPMPPKPKLPFLQNLLKSSQNSQVQPAELQSKNLQQLMEQQQGIPGTTTLPSTFQDFPGVTNSSGRQKAPNSSLFMRGSNNTQHSNQNTKISIASHNSNQSTNKKNDKKKKKKWRLWLPNWNQPIDLVHPSQQEQEISVETEPEISPLPAHVQLKQQLARKQRRGTANRGSRNLGDHLDNSTSFGQGSSSNASNSHINSNRDAASNFDSLINSNNSSFRSTRNDVHSNQPLLVRGKRTKGLAGVTTDDDHTIQSQQSPTRQAQRRRRRWSSNMSINSHNNRHFVPRHVQMHLPNSRGSLLVQQISGLSIDTIARSLEMDHHRQGSSGRGGVMLKSNTIAIPPRSHAETYTTDEGTVDGDDSDDDSHDNADSNNYYTVQELLDSSNKIETRRTTHHDAVLTPNRRRSQIQKQQHKQERGRQDPEGTRFRYWFETSDDDDDDDDLSEDDHASHDDSHDSSFFPGMHRVFGGVNNHHQESSSSSTRATTASTRMSTSPFMQKYAGMVQLECLEEVEDETDRMEDSFRSSSLHQSKNRLLLDDSIRSSSLLQQQTHPYTGRGVDPSFGSLSRINFDESALDINIPSIRTSSTSSTGGRFGSLFSKSSTSHQSSLHSSIQSSFQSSSMISQQSPSQSSIYIQPNQNTTYESNNSPRRRQPVDAPHLGSPEAG